jgi:hypothetical protein
MKTRASTSSAAGGRLAVVVQSLPREAGLHVLALSVGVDIGNAGAQLCCDLRASCVIPVKESEVTSAPSWRTVIKDNVVFAGCTWTDESKSGMLDC